MNKKQSTIIIGSLAAALLISGGITFGSGSITKAWAAAVEGTASAAPEPTDTAPRERGIQGMDGNRPEGKGGLGGKDGKGKGADGDKGAKEGMGDKDCAVDQGAGGVNAGPPAAPGAPGSSNPSTGAANNAPAGSNPSTDVANNAAESNVVGSVVISGGFGTDPVDHGRPVVLIAAALGVPTEVFREAFSGVTPAGGDGGPSSELAQRNKAALLSVLGPYGITNERLDEVSNYYRYNGSKGESWASKPAKATATIVDGVVTGVTITDAGAGYTSNPAITITGLNGKITATATVAYTEDFATNGSITAITLNK
jgi:hypothetical protein